MRFLTRRPALRCWAFAAAILAAVLTAFEPSSTAAVVTGSSQHTLSFSQTPSTGFLSGTALPVSVTLKTIFRTTGVTADQIDGLHANVYTFVASTPQTLDLTALTDVLGASITAARIRVIMIKVNWTTDNLPLLVGNAAATQFTGLSNTTGIINVYPSTAANDGYAIFVAPQTTGMIVDSTHKSWKLDPGTAAGTVTIIIGFCST